jgi:hypothetical protein
MVFCGFFKVLDQGACEGERGGAANYHKEISKEKSLTAG